MVDCKICGHPYCEYAGTQRGVVINCANFAPTPKPQTNADLIRAMSDEELARMLRSTGCPLVRSDAACKLFGNCGDCWLDWLKQPV